MFLDCTKHVTLPGQDCYLFQREQIYYLYLVLYSINIPNAYSKTSNIVKFHVLTTLCVLTNYVSGFEPLKPGSHMVNEEVDAIASSHSSS